MSTTYLNSQVRASLTSFNKLLIAGVLICSVHLYHEGGHTAYFALLETYSMIPHGRRVDSLLRSLRPPAKRLTLIFIKREKTKSILSNLPNVYPERNSVSIDPLPLHPVQDTPH